MPSRAPVLIKFQLHPWSTHVHVSFGSVENSVMSVTKEGFEETAATVFKKKSCQSSAMLIINFSINWIYLESSCFYFPQNDSENNLSSFWRTCLNILNVFWKGRIVVIKSRVVRFSPWSFIFVADTLGSVHTRHETPICQESTMQNNTLSL